MFLFLFFNWLTVQDASLYIGPVRSGPIQPGRVDMNGGGAGCGGGSGGGGSR